MIHLKYIQNNLLYIKYWGGVATVVNLEMSNHYRVSKV